MRRIARPWGGVLVLGLLALVPQRSLALQCGDLDGNCEVAATDALRLLRYAVGLNQPLLCECDYGSICEVRPSAASLVFDCFGDEACSEADPAKPYCDGHVCSECSENEHCGDDYSCDHALYRCMPNCAYQ